ncbi:MAG TPA: IPT/TIG domain-containing protein [Bryobacteraceae bacterium]|jgi:uncharacterized protein (TIGR03437 family)|nr:IPT/TIG domain-containing protein [Bryobacteraceae bacterium]
MKLTSWIFCLELALAGANLFGATLTNHAFALNAPPSASGCAAPIPVDYFESTDQNLVIWVFAQLKTGDAVSISWTTSARILDSSNAFSPVTSDGGYCYWVSIPLASNPPQALGGTWNFNVAVNQTSVFSSSVLVVAPGMPSILRGGVVNAASGTTNAGMISAGSLISIQGANLARNTASATSIPLPKSLDGVSVTFNGKPVGIVSVSPTLVEVQAPWSIPSDTAFVQVDNRGTLTNIERVRVGSSAPGLFYNSSTSANAATVYRTPAKGGAGGWVSAKNPLQRGDTAVFLATGLGAVTNPPVNFASGNKSGSRAVLPISVAFGGVRAASVSTSLYTGSAVQDIGVMYVTVKVPNEVPNGVAVPVTVQVAGAVANPVSVPISGTPPNVSAPSLLSVAGYPAVNAPEGYHPTAAISLSARGVYTNSRTYVRFFDNSGYSATVPALGVYSDRVTSLVPPYVNQQTHQTTAGTVACAIVQYVAGRILVSNAQTIQIAPLYAAPGNLGSMTSKFLATTAEVAREVAGSYIYRQEISGGARFTAPSAALVADQVVTGLQPLVGNAEEVAYGNTTSIDLGTINGNDVSIDSNSIALSDALIAASLAETAAAFVNPPYVSGQTASEDGVEPHSILGSLVTYFGLVAQCNMSWDKLNDNAPNCPSPTQALNTVISAAGESLVEAVDSVKEDAKRFAEGPGLMLGVLTGAEGVAVIGELANTAAIGQGLFHAMRYFTDNDEEKSADYQAAFQTFRELAGDGLLDATKDATGAVIGSIDEQQAEGFQQFAESGLGKIIEQYEKNTLDSPERLTGEEDVTDSSGNNSLNPGADSAPAVEITGAVTGASGNGLQNAGVELSNGDDSVSPIAAGATFSDGTFDLLIPASDVGSVVPDSALFQITALDENGDIATFNGTNVDLTAGTQSIGSYSISYDSDDDGDDDSDGSASVGRRGNHVRHGMARAGHIGRRRATSNRRILDRSVVPVQDVRPRPAPRSFENPPVPES